MKFETSNASNFTIVNENQAVNITCSVTGYPIAKLTIYQNDIAILNDSYLLSDEFVNSVTLRFPRVSRNNNGTYLCRAIIDNSTVITESKLDLLVYCKHSLYLKIKINNSNNKPIFLFKFLKNLLLQMRV